MTTTDPPRPGSEPADRSEFHRVRPSARTGSWAHQRNLPHIEAENATYFVTFRCVPGVVLPPDARDIVRDALRFWDGKRADLDVAVVMPDHVHAILRLRIAGPLSAWLHSVKSYTANQVNVLLSRSGALWQQESFDHIIRSVEEWEEKAHYVRMNPVTRHLAASPHEWPWLLDAYR